MTTAFVLIDDSEPDNFLHQRAIRAAFAASDIEVCTTGQCALAHFASVLAGDAPKPLLTFLDLNMPGMTGWEFLEAYERIPSEARSHALYILSTSPNPDDRTRAEVHPMVDGYLTKPLSSELTTDLYERHGPR